ncbi:MAG: hypothetical protein HZA93_27305 [Verrucomicrobia bacterium]|nr:hypothetical protein [Verrucomicrobiota bacterium]
MNSLRTTALLGLLAVASAVRAEERERNWWPFYVERTDAAGNIVALGGAGPLWFARPAAEGATTAGFRPFWVQTADARGDFRSATFLYPLFSYKADDEIASWSVFKLINRTARRPGAAEPGSLLGTQETFDVWPFWFSRTTGEPEQQYRALFPIAGTVRGRLGFERLSWTLFPLYVENEKKGAVTTSTPWPFVRVTRGAATGFALWPLYGSVERPGVSRDRYWLWPFAYESIRYPGPDDPPGTRPTRRAGVLPFFARAEGPGYVGEDFGWPFFGHTERNRPVNYSEIRWFWPLLVQGRGEGHYVNRWAPFYTHSVIKGYDKTWLAWPLVRHAHWQDEAIAHSRTQLLWFLYWTHEQRSLTHPRTAPAALTHYWPLLSTWDNGAGRRQLQFLSPLAVFFPQLDHVHDTWSPLFALGRYEQRAPGDARLSLLWDGITWEKQEAAARREFHFGPLFSVSAQGEERRVALGNGLLGLRRGAGGAGWKFFWLDFPAKPTTGSTDRR